MSFESIKWALEQPISKSSAKFVLVAMGDCVNAEDTHLRGGMTCWPSCAHLAHVTGLDRKTVQASLSWLKDAGYLVATGEHRGITNQVIVYQLNTPKSGPVNNDKCDETPSLNSPEIGALEQAQKRNSSKNGTGPNLDIKRPVFPHKEARFSRKEAQKRATEPGRNQEGTRKEDKSAEAFVLPGWVNAQHWKTWDGCDKRKKATNDQRRMAVEKLARWRDEGLDHAKALEDAATAGWQGLFEPKQPTQIFAARGGFDKQNNSKYAGANAAIYD